MSDLITALTAFSSFLFTLLGNAATWFTSNILGQIILTIALVSFVVNVIIFIMKKIN